MINNIKGGAELIKILLFSLAIMLSFVGFATYGVPLVVPAPPPVEEKLSGDITIEQYIALGDKIFNGKGTCTLCHSPVGGRAPLLGSTGAVAAERLKDERYKGKATTPEEYLHESMVEPSAFVVSGFGKTGSNDTISPMPNVSKGSIGLSDVEIGAVIAYMQSIAGVEVTVALPTGDAAAASDEAPAEIKIAASAQEAYAKFGCAMCHVIAGQEESGDVGPDLTKFKDAAGTRKPGMSAEMFAMEAIVDPGADIAEGFEEGMPDDFGDQMTVTELNMIVNHLLGKE